MTDLINTLAAGSAQLVLAVAVVAVGAALYRRQSYFDARQAEYTAKMEAMISNTTANITKNTDALEQVKSVLEGCQKNP